MTIQIDTYQFIGQTITDAIDEAIDMASAGNDTATFDFNGVTVTVAANSHAGLIYRDWDRAMDGKIAKEVGPYPARELSADTKANDARIDTENQERRRVADEGYRKKQQERKALLSASLDAAPAMLRDETKWQAGIAAQNGDPYGLGVFAFAEDWARLMQGRIEAGQNLADVADECCTLADGKHGITGFMYGCAVFALGDAWIYGEPLRRWHNAQYGRDDAAGTVNPAVLTVSA